MATHHGSLKDSAKKLLKCFCGCSEMTVSEVQHIYHLSVQGTLINQQASLMLRRFLELRRRGGDKLITEQLLDVYEQCSKYLQMDASVLTLDELDELCELGLPYHMERELCESLKTGERSNIERCLFRIQRECCNEIEASVEYNDYKQAVLDKLKNAR